MKTASEIINCVSHSELDQFEATVNAAMFKAGSGYFFHKSSSLVISYSVDWWPFLCETTGHNGDLKKIRLRENGILLAKVAHCCEAHQRQSMEDTSGGRFFFNASGVFRRKYGTVEWIMGWSLPRESLLLLPCRFR